MYGRNITYNLQNFAICSRKRKHDKTRFEGITIETAERGCDYESGFKLAECVIQR